MPRKAFFGYSLVIRNPSNGRLLQHRRLLLRSSRLWGCSTSLNLSPRLISPRLPRCRQPSAWVNRQIGRPVKAGLIIAVSQIILVSVDFVLRGERGIATGAARAVLILVTWTVMGAVFGAVLTRLGEDQA